MSIVIPNVGKVALLNRMMKLTVDESFSLKLYRNNYTPDAESVLGSFTEANFTNYTAKTLTKSGWTTTLADPIAPCTEKEGRSSYAEQSWTAGLVGNIIYGYYVVGATSGNLLWAQKFALPKELNEDDVLRITPQFKLREEIPC